VIIAEFFGGVDDVSRCVSLIASPLFDSVWRLFLSPFSCDNDSGS